MEGLSFDNIWGEQDIDNLFADEEVDNAETLENEPAEGDEEEDDDDSSEPDGKKKKKENTTTEVDPDDLFDEDEDEPESVGSGKNKKGKEEDADTDDDADGTSPNFYSSIANACAVDGVFPNLDDETIKKATDAESFSDLIEAEVNARFDEKQQRIAKALENGVEPSNIRKYENTINYINSITDDAVAEESEKGEQLRYNLIYQDFLNKGMSAEKAKKFTERTIAAGTDVEDAKEALQSNKEYFSGEYNKLLKEAQDKADEEKADRQKRAKKLEDSLMKDKNLFGDMEVSNDIRKKAFDVVSRPIHKDPKTGKFLTGIQKYQAEHPEEFLKYTGLMFAMTDGFKDFKSFIKGEVRKEKRKGLRELEQTLNGTKRANNGNLRMVTSAKDDPESFISGGMKLDL